MNPQPKHSSGPHTYCCHTYDQRYVVNNGPHTPTVDTHLCTTRVAQTDLWSLRPRPLIIMVHMPLIGDTPIATHTHIVHTSMVQIPTARMPTC